MALATHNIHILDDKVRLQGLARGLSPSKFMCMEQLPFTIYSMEVDYIYAPDEVSYMAIAYWMIDGKDSMRKRKGI